MLLPPSTTMARADVAHHGRAAERVDAANGQLLDVLRYAQHAMRMHAAQIRIDQRARQVAGVGVVHAAAQEDRRSPGRSSDSALHVR